MRKRIRKLVAKRRKEGMSGNEKCHNQVLAGDVHLLLFPSFLLLAKLRVQMLKAQGRSSPS